MNLSGGELMMIYQLDIMKDSNVALVCAFFTLLYISYLIYVKQYFGKNQTV